MDLKGKSVVVTGAGRGIGQTIAVELARKGARVFVARATKINSGRPSA